MEKLVTSIIKDCESRSLKVAVVCSSWIACTVYGSGLAATVHCFYGLGTADMPAKLVLERSMATASLVQRVREVDVIIWDEASMYSSRILELVNTLHHNIASDGNLSPFGGKQLVLVGQFLQLRPVPSRLDDGSFMFNTTDPISAIDETITRQGRICHCLTTNSSWQVQTGSCKLLLKSVKGTRP